ncbi:Protein kinase-like domain protein, partial [Metarhizium majus ARSEF 297]
MSGNPPESSECSWSRILHSGSGPDLPANTSKAWFDHGNPFKSYEPLGSVSNTTNSQRRTSSFVFRWTGQHNDEQSNNTYSHTEWDALLDITKQLSGDQTSVYEGNFHAGGRHIVRRIKLTERGELWLARIPIICGPPVPEPDSSWWTSGKQFTMESEIATMKFISQSTDIPVPRVFAYNTGLEKNPVGLPYLLMECIEGNMLYDLGGPNVLTEEQRIKLRKSIASIQCKLANATLDKLGSLVLKSNGDIDIGPLPAQFGFKGPFDSMADYFLAWTTHNASFKNIHQLKDPKLIRATKSFPQRLKLTTETLMAARSSRTYPIVHPDFLMHNLLLDDSFEVVGVIDWEFAHTAPIEVFAARMNMYASFNPQQATLDLNEEGKQYVGDVACTEMGMSASPRLSETFGSILGDIGLCMQFFEEGRALSFDTVLDRTEKVYLTQL